MKTMPFQLACFFLCISLQLVQIVAQDPSTPKTENLVNFQTDVQPILVSKCLECHGEKEAKGGMRVDQLESLLGYVESGDADASSLWNDYLNTKDPDSIMPPPHGAEAGGLSIAERLVFRTWINEGATGQWKAIESKDESKPEAVAIPQTLPGKVFAFQGLFHPAAVHLPIALIAVSSIFVLFSFFNRETCEPVAYHCLWIGALGAVAACVTGWSYASHEGYGAGFSFNLEKSAIDRHRWLGVFVAVFSLLMVPLARNVRRTADINKKVIWFFAGLIMLASVSIVGFQGGELTYGEGHYAKYYDQLFSSPPSLPPLLTEEMIETDLPGEETDRPSEELADQPKVETTPKSAEPSKPISSESKEKTPKPESTTPPASAIETSTSEATKSGDSPKSPDKPVEETPTVEPKADGKSNPTAEPKTEPSSPPPSEPSSPTTPGSTAPPSTPPEKTEAPSQPSEPPELVKI